MTRQKPTGTVRDGDAWVVIIWGQNPITGNGLSELMIRTPDRMDALVWVRENNDPHADYGDRIDLVLRQSDIDIARARDGKFLWREWTYDGEWREWPPCRRSN